MLFRHKVYVGIFVVCWIWPALHRGLPWFRDNTAFMWLDAWGITSQVRTSVDETDRGGKRGVHCADIRGFQGQSMDAHMAMAACECVGSKSSWPLWLWCVRRFSSRFGACLSVKFVRPYSVLRPF